MRIAQMLQVCYGAAKVKIFLSIKSYGWASLQNTQVEKTNAYISVLLVNIDNIVASFITKKIHKTASYWFYYYF